MGNGASAIGPKLPRSSSTLPAATCCDDFRRAAFRSKPELKRARSYFAEVPCVDGSGLARVFFTCSAGRCSHVFGLFARLTLTAGHNALRGSGPAHKLAFEDALALCGLS